MRMTAPKLTVAQKAVQSVNIVERKLQSSPVFVGLIVTTFLLFSASLVLHFLATFPDLSGGLFSHSTCEILEKFPLNINPAHWALFIWPVICLMQLMWVVYTLGLICRKIEDKPAYLDPVVLSPGFFIFFSVSTAFNIGWLFLWDSHFFLASFVFLVCVALSLLLALAIASSRLSVFNDNMVDQGRKKEVKFLQLIAINGIAAYITYAIILSLINLGLVLTFKWKHPLTNEHSSFICLGILAFLNVVYIGFDMTLAERYTRYALSPYIVMILTLTASLNQRFYPSSMSSIILVAMLGVVSFSLFFKVGLTTYRSCRVHNQYRLMKVGRSDDRPL